MAFAFHPAPPLARALGHRMRRPTHKIHVILASSSSSSYSSSSSFCAGDDDDESDRVLGPDLAQALGLSLSDLESPLVKALMRKDLDRMEIASLWETEKMRAEKEKFAAQAETKTVIAEKEILRAELELVQSQAKLEGIKAQIEKERTLDLLKRKVLLSISLGGYDGTLSLRRAMDMFERDVVHTALYMYPPQPPLKPDSWEQFLDKRPEIRERIERQKPWRKGEVGEKLSRLHATLSEHAHGAYQVGSDAITIPRKMLTKEECLAAAALLQDYVRFEFDPLDLRLEYDANEKRSKKQ